jgi:hypothetical protein
MQMRRRNKPKRQAESKYSSLLAPTRGWYVGENIADAKKGAALILDNYFPLENKIRLRRGSAAFATGLGAKVETLFTYESGAVTKQFGIAGGSVFDASSAGAVGAAVYTGLTNSYVKTALLTTSGGSQFISIVNGADTRVLYDGTTWGTTPAITGVTSSNLSDVWVFQSRLFFVEKNSLKAWYLPVDSIGGAAVAFPLTGVFQLGGTLLAGATWSSEDAGTGLDDRCVFLSSNGEAAVYTGTNPAGTDWRLNGVYRIGKPLGRRCFMRVGGDLAIMTEDGLVPLSQAIQLAEEALSEQAVSKPIAPAWRDAVRQRAALVGWEIIVWKRESMAIVALPALPGESGTQFVANVATGAWCRYLGWASNCFNVFNNRLFYGTADGRVIEAEVGGMDQAQAYSAAVMWPYDDLGAPASMKLVQIARPMMESRVSIAPVVTAQVDYVTTLPPAPAAATGQQPGAQWDVARWDQAVWPGSLFPYREWQGVTASGTAIAMVLQMTNGSPTTPDVFLNRLDVVFETGKVMV